MKRLVFILIITIIVVLALEFAGVTNLVLDSGFQNDNPVSTPTKSEDTLEVKQYQNFTTYFSDASEIYIVQIPLESKINLAVDATNPLNIQELFSNTSFYAAINAGFFLEDNSHAGMLIVDGKQITAFSPLDTQLTHVLALFNGEVKIIDNNEVNVGNLSSQSIDAFQTGPVFIQNSEIASELIESSLNGNGKYKRTVFAQDLSHNYFIVTRKVYTLNELATQLLKFNIWSADLTALNLDGGSSTSMYVDSDEKFQINEARSLPNYLYF